MDQFDRGHQISLCRMKFFDITQYEISDHYKYLKILTNKGRQFRKNVKLM